VRAEQCGYRFADTDAEALTLVLAVVVAEPAVAGAVGVAGGVVGAVLWVTVGAVVVVEEVVVGVGVVVGGVVFVVEGCGAGPPAVRRHWLFSSRPMVSMRSCEAVVCPA